jgi:hypothetical protein
MMPDVTHLDHQMRYMPLLKEGKDRGHEYSPTAAGWRRATFAVILEAARAGGAEIISDVDAPTR